MRKLVVLVASPESLHRNWIEPPRSWSLAISSFGEDDAGNAEPTNTDAVA